MNLFTLIRHQSQEYRQSWEEQRQWVADIIAGAGPNRLILTEHPPVYTIGRSGKSSDVLGGGTEANAEVAVQTGTEAGTAQVESAGTAQVGNPGTARVENAGTPLVENPRNATSMAQSGRQAAPEAGEVQNGAIQAVESGAGGPIPPIPVIETDRGGQVTYHGPGQLVAYVLMNLHPRSRDVRGHVWRLEETMIRTLAAFDVRAERDPAGPGIWVDGEKIGALGVRVRRGVTYHGLSINRDPNLDHFAGIIPCGFRDRSVTSLAALGRRVSRRRLEAVFLDCFTEVFDARLTGEGEANGCPPSPAGLAGLGQAAASGDLGVAAHGSRAKEHP